MKLLPLGKTAFKSKKEKMDQWMVLFFTGYLGLQSLLSIFL